MPVKSPGTSDPWWVIPEGTIGQLFDYVLHPTNPANYGLGQVWTTKQSATEPKGALGGKSYTTKAEAQAAANAANESIANKVAVTPTQNNPLSGLGSVDSFFGDLSQGSTWIRVGEVVLGLILIAVGVARITHAVPVATKVAKTVGAVAI